ncbi:MAG: hypothetical protein FJ358_03685 [Thaumarchaeota archaeon]|nr:hypothetical protein [Nitrososphaerota archaeon]
MSIGKTIDPLKASKIGFSFLLMREERKLIKTYYDKEGHETYNVSIITDKANRISAIATYKIVQTGAQGATARRIEQGPPLVALEIRKDLQYITEG